MLFQMAGNTTRRVYGHISGFEVHVKIFFCILDIYFAIGTLLSYLPLLLIMGEGDCNGSSTDCQNFCAALEDMGWSKGCGE